MNTMDKLEQLAEAAQYDMCGSCVNPKGDRLAHRQRGSMGQWVYPAALPDGQHILLLKILMSNVCENNCLYCVNRAANDRRILTFQPEELSSLFIALLKQQLVQGLFLSSGVYKSALWSMDRMIKTVEILRFHHKFKGFIHLKILPGSHPSQMERAVKLADRVSVNLEAPSSSRLSAIAPQKDYKSELLDRMRLLTRIIHRYNRGRRYGPKGQSTQFIVGAASEPDTEILSTTKDLYDKLDLSRVYYSAFQPAPETPLDYLSPTPFAREHRIYQVDFLFRKYGFNMEEIGFNSQGNLPLNKDPKMIWAETHPEFFPLEINTASREQLLRIPGFGLKTVERILKVRREHRIHCLDQVRMMGAVMNNALGFFLLSGVLPAGRPQSPQLDIWEPESVHFGETTAASPLQSAASTY